LISYIHPSEIPKLKMKICKPDRTVVGNLKNVQNLKMKISINELNEITFNVPKTIETFDDDGFVSVPNPIINQLKSLYKVSVLFNEEKEWFVLSNINKSVSQDGVEQYDITLKSLGYLLRNKKIREWAGYYNPQIDEFLKDALTIEEVLSSLFSYTKWTYDVADSSLLNKLRSFDFSNTTVLDAIINTAETYSATIVWDTENQKVVFYNTETYFKDKGFTISKQRYLKSLSLEEKSDEIVTRLRVYGKDGLSIQRVNPLGTDYIEDLSVFMEGYSEDEIGNVISSSYYMSDKLCSSLLSYQKYINDNVGYFDTQVSEIGNIEESIISLESQLFDLSTQRAVLVNTIDVKQTQGQDASVELSEKQSLDAQISEVEAQIATEEDTLKTKKEDLVEFNNSLKFDNYCLSQLGMTQLEVNEIIKEYDEFIIEDVWEDGNYFEDQGLYDDALKVFKEINQFKNELSVDIINFFQLLEGNKDWKRIDVGDIVKIKVDDMHKKFNLLEINIDFESHSISLEITNLQSLEDDDKKLTSLIYDSIGTSGVVDMNKYKWNKVNKIETDVDRIINGRWEAAKNEIVAGVNETVTVNERGITITDSSDIDRFVRMTNSVIGLTEDGGQTFRTAITPSGISAEEIIGRIMITENLYIENASGLYSFNHDGFTVDGGAITITGGLPKNQLDPNFAEGLFELDKDYTNGVRLDSLNGLTVTRSDGNVRGIFNATDGIKFQTMGASGWEDDLYYDSDDNSLRVSGIINALDLQVNGVSVLTTDDLINGGFIDQITTDQLVAGSAKISTAMIENLVVGSNVTMGSNAQISWGNVTDAPAIPQDASDIGALDNSYGSRLTKLTSTGIYTGTVSANNIEGGTITGVTINVTTDANVGDNLYLGGYYDDGIIKSIYFNNQANISGGGGSFGGNVRVNADTFIVNSSYLSLDSSSFNYDGSMSVDGTVNATTAVLDNLNVTNVTRMGTSEGEYGYCGVGGKDSEGVGSGIAVAGQGVNFKINKNYSPSSVSLMSYSNNTPANTTSINSYGFYLYIMGGSTNEYVYWRGRYYA
jgi:hypothetical protein